MSRRKRFGIFRVAVGLAAVAVAIPAGAAAEPTVEIPYLSHGVGVTEAELGIPTSNSPDDRAFAREPRSESTAPPVGIPYLSHGVGVSEAELGIATSNSPDDRAFARELRHEVTPVTTERVTSSADVSSYVTGVGLALLILAGGASFAVWHSRRTSLSPA